MTDRTQKAKTLRPPPATSHPVDIHVGQRVRARRKALNISQQFLANHLRVSFQQLQKYERGINRISASKLYEIATELGVSMDYLFDGLKDRAPAPPSPDADHQVQAPVEEVLLLDSFRRMKAAERKFVMNAVRRIAARTNGT